MKKKLNKQEKIDKSLSDCKMLFSLIDVHRYIIQATVFKCPDVKNEIKTFPTDPIFLESIVETRDIFSRPKNGCSIKR